MTSRYGSGSGSGSRTASLVTIICPPPASRPFISLSSSTSLLLTLTGGLRGTDMRGPSGGGGPSLSVRPLHPAARSRRGAGRGERCAGARERGWFKVVWKHQAPTSPLLHTPPPHPLHTPSTLRRSECLEPQRVPPGGVRGALGRHRAVRLPQSEEGRAFEAGRKRWVRRIREI